ncbi:transport and Golgi organization protein 2 isoform X2 [Pectinophora gossypiella]|nr:transport and Golgi organization protein 2 isoform X2 [Pectinophora gossypiella]
MCILFLHNGSKDLDSDYRLVLVSNRDELYDRPSKDMAPWNEDPGVIGGRDLEAGCDGGTWLALSPLRHKIGVLLNLPNITRPNAKTRGRLVADFVKSDAPTDEYVDSMKGYASECNHFVFIAIELACPTIKTYCNATDKLSSWEEASLGFSNSYPETPLKKADAGKMKLKDICTRLNKVSDKEQLTHELIEFLKSKERHLPDPQLKANKPDGVYEKFSSIYVSLPELRYGTRTHTVILVTKSGCVDVVEITLQPPIDLDNPKWKRTEMQFTL